MYMKTLLTILLCAGPVLSANLDCQVRINLDEVSNSVVVTSVGNKILITENSQLVSFVTETAQDVYSIEAFIPAIDARIYSEGILINTGENLTATAWARDVLADVSCKKLK